MTNPSTVIVVGRFSDREGWSVTADPAATWRTRIHRTDPDVTRITPTAPLLWKHLDGFVLGTVLYAERDNAGLTAVAEVTDPEAIERWFPKGDNIDEVAFSAGGGVRSRTSGVVHTPADYLVDEISLGYDPACNVRPVVAFPGPFRADGLPFRLGAHERAVLKRAVAHRGEPLTIHDERPKPPPPKPTPAPTPAPSQARSRAPMTEDEARRYDRAAQADAELHATLTGCTGYGWIDHQGQTHLIRSFGTKAQFV